MSAWGASTTDESKPKFPWLISGGGLTVNNQNKVYATEQGWTYKWAWGEEILVGIGGLASQLGAPTIQDVESINGATVQNEVTPSQLAFMLVWNEPVVVTGTPTIVAIGTAPASNVILSYDSTQSDPDAGRLAFANTTVDLSGMTTGTLTVNATSGAGNFTNFANITDKTNTSVSIASTIVGSNTVTIAAGGSSSVSPSASKSPSASASPSASFSPSASKSPSASVSPSASASLSFSPSASKSPSASFSPSASPSPS